jgi:hypothetical protein
MRVFSHTNSTMPRRFEKSRGLAKVQSPSFLMHMKNSALKRSVLWGVMIAVVAFIP